MKIVPLLITTWLFAQPLFGDSTRSERKVWGVSLRWEVGQQNSRKVSEMVESLQKELSESMDPDCLWRARLNDGGCANSRPDETAKIDALAKKIARETSGLFDVEVKRDGIASRDFAGLSQGYFLNRLKGFSFGWFADFAGDFFLTPGFKPSSRLTIGDPLIEAVPFAEVKMPGGGWMIASVSRALGASLRHPRLSAEAWKEDFQKIVLFASPAFDGARVDAWATALMVGGKPLLEKLGSLKEFQGKWAYFGFDANSEPFWSSHLKVDSDVDPIVVEVPKWE